MSEEVPRCGEKVGEPPHYIREHTCDRRAAYIVFGLHGPKVVCGTHRLMLLRRGFKDAPQQPMSEESGE